MESIDIIAVLVALLSAGAATIVLCAWVVVSMRQVRPETSHLARLLDLGGTLSRRETRDTSRVAVRLMADAWAMTVTRSGDAARSPQRRWRRPRKGRDTITAERSAQ